MKNLIQTINEERFGYTWQNAFVSAMVALAEIDEKKCLGILDKWFGDNQTKHEISTFLYRLGHEPQGKSSEDILHAITSTLMDDKYNLK